jgi:hypothetical protein
MTIQEAIKLAIENGYNWERRKDYMAGGSTSECLLVCDPKFWQCLGKGMGWGRDYFHEDDGKTYWDYDYHCPMCGAIETNTEYGCPEGCEYDVPEIISWQHYWRELIDHLAEGKTIEDFFKTLNG